MDRHQRAMRSLRISVIDRCDLRCRYCMPEKEYVWLPGDAILDFDEIERLARAFAGLGVSRLRLTGGEPLLRAGLEELVARLRQVEGIEDLAITTNGTRLAQAAAGLKQAGMRRVTVSLDTLRPDRFAELTGRRQLDRVLDGLRAAAEAGFEALKVNTVVIRGFNDDELSDILALGRELSAEVRFIEYMDVGGATCWSSGEVLSRRQILEQLAAAHGPVLPVTRTDNAPAERYQLADGTPFGIVASVTEPFCRSCDRSRITADGMWYLCLYASQGFDLRRLLREQDDEQLLHTIHTGWLSRQDRGAEERRDTPQRGVLYQVEELRKDPHREMHTRGG